MRLSENFKYIICDNIKLIKYCKEVGIDIERLKKCNIERMGDNLVFVLSKENKVESKSLIPLDIDLVTQPDIVLIMKVTDNYSVEFETTNKTLRVLV